MATTISKNEDGTYKLSSDTTSEENLTKEQIEDRIATYKANIEANQAEIDALEAICEEVETMEAEELAEKTAEVEEPKEAEAEAEEEASE